MKNNYTRLNTLLWVLVIFNSVFIIMGFFVYQVGAGRWECSEYQNEMMIHCPEGCSIPLSGDELVNKCIYECSTYQEEVCVKEVWTHNIKGD